MTSIAYDTHLHSEYSSDSETPLVQQLEKAVSLGLKGICITDHIDYEFPVDQIDFPIPDNTPPFWFDEIQYRESIKKLRTSFPALSVCIGVECGLQTMAKVIEKNQLLCKNPEWDYVIGSLHLVSQKDPYYPIFWEGNDPKKCVLQYFEKLLCNLEKFYDFDSLGHLDYIVRYAPKDFVYSPKEYFEIIQEILLLLIRKDIALEINTSGFKSLTMPNPHLDILTLYASCGGELITVGSDAHTPEYIGYHFNEVETLMKKAGLHEYVTYHKRKPTFHSI